MTLAGVGMMFYMSPELAAVGLGNLLFPMGVVFKRYYKIDQHSARHFKYNGVSFSSPPPFLCSQIITPFSNSMISTNQDTGF